MKTLSRMIAQEERKYSLDSRKETKERVAKICDFLLKNNYIRSNDTYSILTVVDTYRYIPNYSRDFGETYNLRFGGEYSFLNVRSYQSNRSIWNNCNYTMSI